MLKAELDRKTAQLNEIRGAEIEMRNKLEENQKVLAENQKRSQYWQDKLKKLSTHNMRFVKPSWFQNCKLIALKRSWRGTCQYGTPELHQR